MKVCGKSCHSHGFQNSCFVGYDHHIINQDIHEDDRVQRRIASNGVIRNLVVLLRFEDHDNRELPSASDISDVMNKLGGDPKLAPTGSVRDVFRLVQIGNRSFIIICNWIFEQLFHRSLLLLSLSLTTKPEIIHTKNSMLFPQSYLGVGYLNRNCIMLIEYLVHHQLLSLRYV